MATQPTVLITAVPHGLADVKTEAQAVQENFGGASCAELRLDMPFADLGPALAGKRIWWFAGHGDAPLVGEFVPAFFNAGAIESVSIKSIAETVRAHSDTGQLQMVVLTGCQTLGLGKALQNGITEFIMRPHQMLTRIPFWMVAGVYGATYATANSIDVACERQCTGAAVHLRARSESCWPGR